MMMCMRRHDSPFPHECGGRLGWGRLSNWHRPHPILPPSPGEGADLCLKFVFREITHLVSRLKNLRHRIGIGIAHLSPHSKNDGYNQHKQQPIFGAAPSAC